MGGWKERRKFGMMTMRTMRADKQPLYNFLCTIILQCLKIYYSWKGIKRRRRKRREKNGRIGDEVEKLKNRIETTENILWWWKSLIACLTFTRYTALVHTHKHTDTCSSTKTTHEDIKHMLTCTQSIKRLAKNWAAAAGKNHPSRNTKLGADLNVHANEQARVHFLLWHIHTYIHTHHSKPDDTINHKNPTKINGTNTYFVLVIFRLCYVIHPVRVCLYSFVFVSTVVVWVHVCM